MLYLIYALMFLACFLLGMEITPFRKKGPRGASPVSWVINRVALLNSGLKLSNFRKRTEEKIKYAGVGLTTDSFLAIKEVLAVSLFVLLTLALGRLDIWAFLIAIVGFLLPDMWLKERIDRRKKSIIRKLPYFLDLLTLCVEAGLDFGAAINRIVQKSKPSPLTDELSIMQGEIKMGRSREDALHNLSRRLGIIEVSSLVSNLIQSDRMGISLGQALRIQSEQMRNACSISAEKKSYEAPVKLLFPLIIFIFPVVFIVLMGPVLLQLLAP